MARTNRDTPKTATTHGGATVLAITPEQELRRSVMASLLWEENFYESGQSHAERVATLVPQVEGATVAALAIEARTQMHLRHMPLFLVNEMVKHESHRRFVRATLPQIIQRADELAEFLALYWKDGKRKLAKQVQRGLADAFPRFNAYALAKYNQANVVKLRDVLFLSHAKPRLDTMAQTADPFTMAPAVDRKGYKRGLVMRHTDGQGAVWTQLINDELAPPDTWEVALSSGADKKATWERLLRENKLGALALIRNLRNMEQASVDTALIKAAMATMNTDQVLPFRFVAAAQHATRFEPDLDAAMLRSCAQWPKLPGVTVLIVDVSGSMYAARLSEKSEMDRAYVACALAALAREICESVNVYATAGSDHAQTHKTTLVPARRGIALVDAIYRLTDPLGGGGIFLKQSLEYVWSDRKQQMADRVIVITDGQDTDRGAKKGPEHCRQIATHQYIINVASDRNGIGYGAWTQIDGWSERVLEYIRECEHTLPTTASA